MGGRKALIAPLILGIWLAVAVPADARNVDLQPSGTIRLEWHGDPARGCEAAGVCGYSGTGSFTPGSAATLDAPFDLEVLDGSMVVRVTGSGGSLCVDRVVAPELDVIALKREPVFSSFGGLNAGRCAGPNLDPALAALPTPPRIPRGIRSGSVIDLSGSASFATGPFTGTATSTLRLRAISSDGESDTFYSGGGGNTREREPRYALLRASFEITRLAGAARIAFDGLPSPECVPSGACGAHGTSSFALDTRGFVTFMFLVRAPHRVRSARRAVLAALRSGRGRFLGEGGANDQPLAGRGSTVDEIAGYGEPACRATSHPEAPDLSIVRAKRKLHVALGGLGVFGGSDIFGTFCPGPLQTDVFGSGALAATSVPTSAVLRKALVLRLRRGGRFGGHGYGGVRDSSFTLRLKRRSLSLHFARGTYF